ncbi:hypothetical protein HGRIS_011009 [Hohenbuehelia grisea]|uniref:Pheromone-regulated membrane protein n=1 Tax=Hohenbuehelia grisea TaxID=104357 RepID=A0ABR3IZB1_9AGAR
MPQSEPSGSKTPRKVQWVDTATAQRELSMLDEEGLDPNAFRRLADALERYRSSVSSTRGQSGQPLRQPSFHTTPMSQQESPTVADCLSDYSDTNSSTPGTNSPPSHDVPGQFIDAGESAGLPTDPNRDHSNLAMRQARRLVRAHTKKSKIPQFRRSQYDRLDSASPKDLACGTIKSKDFVHHTVDSACPAKDLESAAGSAPMPTISRGVLSTILALYDDGHLPASGLSTPSRRSTFDGSPDPHHAASDRHDSSPPTKLSIAPKRPGYHLSRYSLDSSLVGQTPATLAHTLRRPESTHFEKSTHARAGSDSAFGTPKEKWTATLKDLPFAHSVISLSHGKWPGKWTPGTSTPASMDGDWTDEKDAARREKKRKRKRTENYITRHVAEILQRQEFILKLTRAMMMFGAPSNRLQAQIQSTARVLGVELSFLYLPDVALVSFADSSTATSSVKLIRQGSSLELGKLKEAYQLYWQVIHDNLSVCDASTQLDELMHRKQAYRAWQLVLIGGMCSSAICTVGFSGSFIDALIVFPMGAFLVAIQLLSVRNELYSNVFELSIATIQSFLAAALASTHHFCYAAIASSSVVLILPGFIVLSGALEIMSRNLVAGSVRLCYAVVYSLFLGFGLAVGAQAYEKFVGKDIVGPEDYSCSESHNPAGPWYQRTPSIFWAFLTVPMYSFCLSLRLQMPWNCREMLMLVLFSCVGWVTNHFTATQFQNQSDISAAVGAFAVGLVSNLYGRFFSGNAFVVMITGILFQLPSGLGSGGLLTFASQQSSGVSSSSSYLSGFRTAMQLISVGIGLSVGLGISLVVVHPIQSRRRAGGVFSL